MFQSLIGSITNTMKGLEVQRFGEIEEQHEGHHESKELAEERLRLQRERQNWNRFVKDQIKLQMNRQIKQEIEEQVRKQLEERSDILTPVAVHRWSMKDNTNYAPSPAVHREPLKVEDFEEEPTTVDFKKVAAKGKHPLRTNDKDDLVPVYDVTRARGRDPRVDQVLDPVLLRNLSTRPLPTLKTYKAKISERPSADPHGNDVLAAEFERETAMGKEKEEKKDFPYNYGRILPQLVLDEEDGNVIESNIQNGVVSEHFLFSSLLHVVLICVLVCLFV